MLDRAAFRDLPSRCRVNVLASMAFTLYQRSIKMRAVTSGVYQQAIVKHPKQQNAPTLPCQLRRQE